MPQYEFESIPAAPGDAEPQLLALSDRVRRRELYGFVDIPPNVLQNPSPPSAGAVHFYSAAGGIDTFRGWLAVAVNQGLLQARLKQSRIAPAELAALLAGVPVESMNLISRDAQTGVIVPGRKKGAVESFAVPYVLVMLLTMLVLLSSNPMLTTVAQDKLQRVFEMMLSSASPFEIIAGKVLATVGTSLISSALYIAGGIIALQGMSMFKLIPFGALPWFFLYLVAEVTMMCALGAALGSACSSPQDAQQLAILLMMPMIVPLFLLVPVLQQPGGAMATGLSLFPLFTPMLMLVRQSMPDGVPFWQPWVGLVGVLACTLVGTWAAARIFRIGILSQGATPKPGELVRWAIRG
jgi:ABC-2 type transport system permease protein